MVITLNGKEFQRDAGMTMLENPTMDDYDPTVRNEEVIETQLNNYASRIMKPLQEGEYVIMKDDPNAGDWYCAEIRRTLADRIEVNYYTTATPALVNY